MIGVWIINTIHIAYSFTNDIFTPRSEIDLHTGMHTYDGIIYIMYQESFQKLKVGKIHRDSRINLSQLKITTEVSVQTAQVLVKCAYATLHTLSLNNKKNFFNGNVCTCGLHNYVKDFYIGSRGFFRSLNQPAWGEFY